MIADTGAGARLHILSQRKKMIWAAIKNPLPRMIADMGAGARPCLKIEHDLIEYALQIFLSAA